MLVLLLVTSCYRSTQTPGGSPAKPAKTTPAKAKPKAASAQTSARAQRTPKVIYTPSHDEEIKAIFDLAKRQRWEEAETQAAALWARDPQDPAAICLRDWIRQQRERNREQALEDQIRSIEANSSVFNPTVKDLLTEKKDRGLPPRKDVRDAVQQIKATPYIPESYGRTNYLRGLMFDFESRQGRMAKILEKEVSVVLEDATLESIIFNVGQAEGINFVADKSLAAFKTKLSVNMKQVKLSEFLRYISRNLDLQFQVGEELIWIVDSKDPKKVLEETRFYRLQRGFVLPAEFGPPEVTTTTTTANNVRSVQEVQKMAKFVNDQTATMPAIEQAITNFFTGKYLIDYERNVIVAQGTPEQLEILENVIENFNQPIQQVLIEARFVTVSQAAFLRLGMIWGTGLATTTVEPTSDQTGMAFLGVAPGFQWNWTNVFGVSELTATLTALEQSGESQTLSAPRLTLINNRPAIINDGKVQYYYEQYQVKSTILERKSTSQLVPDGKPTKITSGASLQVLASIGGDGNTILLALNPRVNSDVEMVPFMTITDTDDAGNIVSKQDINLPQYRTQDLSTRVAVRSGQTVVMGGVLERQQTTFVESVPVLGNLPLLGSFFRRRSEIDRPRYLLIFVTATLLAETGEYLIYEEATGRNIRIRGDSGAGSLPAPGD